MDALVQNMRIIANFRKGEELRFISHLDIQRLVQRAMRRAKLPLSYSQGFNPHPVLSFASALAVGYTSDAEWMDVRLETDMPVEEFVSRINTALPRGLVVLRAQALEQTLPALTALIQRARYAVTVYLDAPVSADRLTQGIEALQSGPIIVTKRTKGGMKQVDIRPQLLSMRLMQGDTPMADGQLESAKLAIEGVLNASGGLQIELLLQALMQACSAAGRWRVHRAAVYFEHIEV